MNWYWIILIILGVLAFAYLMSGLALFLYLCLPRRESSASLAGNESRTLYSYVPVIKEKARANGAMKHENVSCSAFDGVTLHAKLYPCGGKDTILILVHGYQSSIFWDFAACFEWYAKSGCSLLALENRAHGSDGRYIGFGALDQKDVQTWMKWLVDRYGENIRIGLVGFSMGAATVMLTSGNYPIAQLKCVIEDSGYSSLKDVIRNKIRKGNYPKIPIISAADLWCRILAGYSFGDACPEKAIAKSQVPTLFIHGTGDTFVPFWMLDRVYNACPGIKEKAVFQDARHGEASFLEPDRYRDLILGFVNRYLLEKKETETIA